MIVVTDATGKNTLSDDVHQYQIHIYDIKARCVFVLAATKEGKSEVMDRSQNETNLGAPRGNARPREISALIVD
jgi:hypothetical protein